jgi:hypothetical protein
MNSAEPICDVTLLQDAFKKHSSWFDILRNPRGGHKGIRDVLEHEAARMALSLHHIGDETPRHVLSFGVLGQDLENEYKIWRQDLLTTLSHVLDGFCSLCSEIHASIRAGGRYEQGDCPLSFGNDDDVTGFWPEIS